MQSCEGCKWGSSSSYETLALLLRALSLLSTCMNESPGGDSAVVVIVNEEWAEESVEKVWGVIVLVFCMTCDI